MGGQDECDACYVTFCLECEKYHITIPEAITYYENIIHGMERSNVKDDDDELVHMRGRVKLLGRFMSRRDKVLDGKRNPFVKVYRKTKKVSGGKCSIS